MSFSHLLQQLYGQSLTQSPAVDTSTGVLSPAAHFSSLAKKHSPSTLIALDAVCAVASEEIRFDDWGLDVVISATQKGLGAPPGLSVMMASKRAIEVSQLDYETWQQPGLAHLTCASISALAFLCERLYYPALLVGRGGARAHLDSSTMLIM